jgi:anti-anti-sigma factor
MDEPILDISSATRDEVVEIRLRGELDLATVPLVRDALDGALKSGCARIAVIAEELTYMDSSGLTCFAAAAAEADDLGIKLQIEQTSNVVRRVFEITGLDALLVLEQPNGSNGR